MSERPINPVTKEMQTRRPNKKGGKGPRQSGNRVERMVAKETDGKRVPMSGGAKHFMTGDVTVPDADGKPLVKLEVKARAPNLTTRGEKTVTLPLAVLDQMVKESEACNEIGALWIHPKGRGIEDGFIVLGAKHWLRFLALAKLGATMEK